LNPESPGDGSFSAQAAPFLVLRHRKILTLQEGLLMIGADTGNDQKIDYFAEPQRT
jgi:hypothetical protein